MKTIFILCAVFAFTACDRTDEQAAEKSAIEYSQNIEGATGKVSCTADDSDGDGYVSCSIFVKGESPVNVQCGAEKYCFNCARGCKYVEQYKYSGKGRRGE